MTQSELDVILGADPYHVPRKEPREAEIRLFLREVDYHCPLCGAELQSRMQAKPKHKQFQIAHIYPNRPTIQQYAILHGLERLGNTSEDFENKIALCLQCHSRQDFQTTVDDYERLLSIKKKLLEKTALHDAINDLYLEANLRDIVERISKTPYSELITLSMSPVRIAEKFEDEDAPIRSRIMGYVTQYYTYVRDLFRERDGKDGFVFSALCSEIKTAFTKLEAISKDKEEVFSQLSVFIKRKTVSSDQTACDIVAAFFVQNCEVFNEIPR